MLYEINNQTLRICCLLVVCFPRNKQSIIANVVCRNTTWKQQVTCLLMDPLYDVLCLGDELQHLVSCCRELASCCLDLIQLFLQILITGKLSHMTAAGVVYFCWW